MKKYKKKTYKRNIAIKVSIVLLIIIGFFSSFTFILNRYQSIADFSFENPPEPASFKEADEDFLNEVAYGLDTRYAKYHLPLNQSAGALFVNDSADFGGEVSYTNVSRYYFSDNEALWTGIDYTGWTYKYLTAQQEGNQTMENFAQNVLINMTTGMGLLMKVPNGGLGPEYSGILARGVAPPDAKDVWPHIFSDTHPKHFNGTGKYSNWRYRAYTSNDEFGGYYLFLALATKYLRHIPYINDTVSKIVDQLCFNMIHNNFLGIHGNGGLTGVDQKPRIFSGGFWAPLLFKMGSLFFPKKYTQTYIQLVANEMYYLSNSEGGTQETIANYYAYNFGSCVNLAFLLVEDPNTEIWRVYFDGYYNSMWSYTKYHRNAWANAIFLMICHENQVENDEVEDDLEIISKDVKDQLQRYGESHFPNRDYLIEKHLPEDYEIIKPVDEFVNNLGLSENLQDFMGIDAEEEFLNKPLTIDYYDTDGWNWNNNPYTWREDHDQNLLYEETGSTFLVPYWMLRYCGYIGGGN